MVYMGISYNVAELEGSIWMNNAIMGILDVVANGLGIIGLAKFGRKTLLFWTLALTGTFLLFNKSLHTHYHAILYK